ncbi:hypothetical protein GCM10027275_37620 [Rhabdobacter roseus]|uniref:DUF4833 domain-containing protein n=1 Tax=Rhabdobacter roseus TaxID=1655419 RepID=A0A840U1W2_9BACT|nr:DUF4833 domain-containing protein [Rhabdobacter roseus]MBB5285829.1 hypothetical protein [Rhabdobacter roseus]
MKKIHLFSTLVSLISLGFIAPQSGRERFPEPPHSANRLFYIQRSNDANTVVYDANLRPDKTFDPAQPVNVYWLRYAEAGQRQRLSAMQWQLAYGYKHKESTSDRYELLLNAFRKRPMTLVYQQGKPLALTLINGRTASLQKIFVQLEPGSALLPKVQYLELYGMDTRAQQPVYEKIVL